MIPATIGDGNYPVTAIGERAFERDWYDTSTGFSGALVLPDSLVRIERNAFDNCKELTGTLSLPAGLQYIGSQAFYSCGFTGGLAIPDGVETIDSLAFAYCRGFSGTLTIPDSVERLNGMAFLSCDGFTGPLVISAGAQWETDGNPFAECEGITAFLVDESNPNFSSWDGMLFDKQKTKVIACPLFKRGNLAIPNSVTEICEAAFMFCKELTGNLVIPFGVTTIGSSAFDYCSGFTGDLVIPSSVKTIEGQAFLGCTGFSGKVTIAGSVTYIGLGAFNDFNKPVFKNIYMGGNAPEATGADESPYQPSFPPNAVIHYDPTKSGWTTPTWKGYKAVPDYVSTDEATAVSLDRTYFAMEMGGAAETIIASVKPAGQTATFTWTAEAADGTATNVIEVDQSGSVTALSVGTAYAVATAEIDGAHYTARCRVDVTAAPIAVDGVQLGAPTANVELNKTNYTTFDLLLALPQNASAFSMGAAPAAPVDNGVAVSAARFTDDAVAAKFDLVVVDDMRVAIVPKPEAIAAPKSVLATYKSKVTVTIGGQEYETQTSLTVKVKKTVPVIKTTAIKANPFYTGQTLLPAFTGGKVTSLAVNTAKATARTPAIPAWLTLSGEACALSLANDAPKSGTGTAHLLATVEGWAVPAAVSVPVQMRYVAPQLKLNQTSVVFNPNASASQGIWWLWLACKKNTETLRELHVTGIEAPDGYAISSATDIGEYSNSMYFTLTPTEDPVPGKITFNVTFDNTEAVLPLTLTVKVAPVRLNMSAASNIPINLDVPDSLAVYVSPYPSDYIIDNLFVKLTNARGTTDYTDQNLFNITHSPMGSWSSSYRLTITPNANTPANTTFKLWVKLTESAKPVSMTFKTAPAGTAVGASVKVAGGALNLSYSNPWTFARVSYKNYHAGNGELVAYTVSEKAGRSVTDVTDKFEFNANVDYIGSYVDISVTEPWELYGNAYYLTAHVTLSNGTTVDSAPVRLPVKRTVYKDTPISIKLSKSSVTLLENVDDETSVTCSFKPYASAVNWYPAPEIEVCDATGRIAMPDALDTSYSSGTLTVAINSNTVAGKTYKVKIAATTWYPKSVLTVKVMPTNTVVTGTIRAKGTLDVIRPGTSVVLTPTYRNYSGKGTWPKNIEIVSNEEDCTSQFATTHNADGTFTVSARSATSVDSTKKYKVRLTLELPGGTVETPYVALPVTMGSAPSKTDVKQVRLFGKDRYSTGTFTVAPVDRKLGPVAGISIKDARQAELFEVRSLGENRFAIGFKDGIVTTRTSATVRFDVYYAGNLTPKPNATISVKVNIVP